MKKRLFLICIVFALMFAFSLGGVSVYANEVEDTEIITEVEEETEIDSYITNLTEYIIAGVLGLIGTTGVAVLFRRQLKKLFIKIGEAISALWQNKKLAEEDIDNLKDETKKTLASLQKVKKELVDTNKEQFDALSKKVNLVCLGFCYMASGLKELVGNGTAESISDLLKEIDKEVVKNASEEIQQD